MDRNALRLAARTLVPLFVIGSAHNVYGQFILGTPAVIKLPDNASSEHVTQPDISPDDLTLYYQAGRVGGSAEIFFSERESVADAWQTPVRSNVNSRRHDDAGPAVSPDRKELFFSDGLYPQFSGPPRPDGVGSGDIWTSVWNEETGGWSAATNVTAVNSSSGDFGVNLSADGLEMYFTSEREGGAGGKDIWMSRRDAVGSPWKSPTNLGATVNGSADDSFPALSPDGRMLVFASDRPGTSGRSNLWMATRGDPESAWNDPIHLGFEVNNTYWTIAPDFSYDGRTLYFSRLEADADDTIWSVDLMPLQTMPLRGDGDVYLQDFDVALSPTSTAGSRLPLGWTTTVDGTRFIQTTTKDFPHNGAGIRSGETYNAGEEQDDDRALAVGVRRGNSRRAPSAPIVQFLSRVEGEGVAALQLRFDLEAWDAEGRANSPGMPAFDVSLEANAGDGFLPITDLGGVAIPDLTVPDGEYLNGNLDPHRALFDSGARVVSLPAGATLRIRWQLPETGFSDGWVFGLDNVELRFFGTLLEAFDCNGDGLLTVSDANCSSAASLEEMLAASNLVRGDADGDGHVHLSDFFILANNFGQPGQYTDGDFTKDGQVLFQDFLILAANFGQVSAAPEAVPEPATALLSLLGFFGLAKYRLSR